jgi:hypothetical protein
MTSLYISYAYMHCTPELVLKTFSTILGGNYIETIHNKVKKHNHGKPYLTFQICFKENTPGLQEIIDRIYLETFIQVAYEMSWDWLLHKYVDRYWKVYIYAPHKPNFKAHIMERVTSNACPELFPVSFVNEHENASEPIKPCKYYTDSDSDTEWDELQASLDKFDSVRTQTPPRVTEEETEEVMYKRLDEARRMEYQEQKRQKHECLYSSLGVD